jgi:hypothetical protein
MYDNALAFIHKQWADPQAEFGAAARFITDLATSPASRGRNYALSVDWEGNT